MSYARGHKNTQDSISEMKQDIDEANTNFTESHKYERPTLDDRLGRSGGDAILADLFTNHNF